MSFLCQFPLPSKSPGDSAEGPIWMLYVKKACVTAKKCYA